jgi:hypothetical protein
MRKIFNPKKFVLLLIIIMMSLSLGTEAQSQSTSQVEEQTDNLFRLSDGSIDCDAYLNYTGFEPAAVAASCKVSLPKIDTTSIQSPSDNGFAQDVGYVSDNFVSFPLNNFTGQTVIGTSTDAYYGMDFDPTGEVLWALNDTNDQLGTINLTSGVFTSVVACPPGGGEVNWTGLSIHPATGVFYASTATKLFTINPVTGSATLIGSFGTSTMIAIAINMQGQMYGHDISSDSIYSIDMSTGTATLIGATGYSANYAQGMDFDNEDGTLYIFLYLGSGSNVFGTVNLTTGAVTPLAVNAPLGEFEGAVQTAGMELSKVYLPLIMGKPYEMPETPVLEDINNSGYGGYTLNWSGSSQATTYTLQEDDNIGFTSPTVAYSGANTTVDLNRGLGTYYYRVNASNPKFTSPWSNIKSAVVTIESPNVGLWTGSVSGGNWIELEIINAGRMIDQLSINVNWNGTCGVSSTTYYYYDLPINSSGHFYSSHLSGSNIGGDFLSSTTASGTFYAVLDTGSCSATRSGTWSANYVP